MTFEQLKNRALAEQDALKNSPAPRIYVNTAACGRAAGALSVLSRIRSELAQKKIAACVVETGCLGFCHLDPLVAVEKPGRPRVFYGRVTPDTAASIIAGYLVGDDPRPDLACFTFGEAKIDGVPSLFELPAWALQARVALRNCGLIDPGSIAGYIAVGGYAGLAKVLAMTLEEAIAEIAVSGLSEPAGAGLPAGEKWRACRRAPGPKHLVLNALTPEDLFLIEGDPHAVLEGVLIAAYACGAERGFACVAENPFAAAKLKAAAKQLAKVGLLGDGILGSGFRFHLEIVEVPAALVLNEETALWRALQGERPMPSPAGELPAVVQRAETLAAVSAVFQKGAAWYAGFGPKDNPGTKVLVLAGRVARPGVAEFPLGTPLGEIVSGFGGGAGEGRSLKAVLAGGPLGNWLPASALDLPLGTEVLPSGGCGEITVATEEDCLVDLTRHILAHTHAESCGRCVLCREGTGQLHEILAEITEGKGKPDDPDLLADLGAGVKAGSLCSLGQNAPNPVLSALAHFRSEFEAHIKRKRCPARVCGKFTTFYILLDRCRGCPACREACPEAAIAGGEGLIHVIDQEKCTKCGLCLPACPFGAVAKASGLKPLTPAAPVPVGSWGKKGRA
ncbi:MAG: NADH-ubiquinone oxidoreductase-F iron-sulfur binding region domain-containing protein [Bacillota bacterium]